MQLTLTKARKLDQKLTEKIKQMSAPQTVEVRLKDSDRDTVMGIVDQKRVEQVKAVEDMVKMVQTKYKVRSLVNQANQSSGISDKLNKMAEMEASLSVYNTLKRTPTTKDVELLADELEIEQSNQKNVSEYSGVKTTMNVAIMSEETKNSLEEKQQKVKRELEDLKDEVHGLNFSTKITLDSDLVSFLQKNKVL